jgi:hypothetical protein
MAMPEALWSMPSLESTCSALQLATPESASAHAKLTVTAELFQPAAFGATDRDALMLGAVLSMLMPDTVALALLPALSVAVPVTDWFAPSIDSVVGALQLATPESASVHVKLTVTSVLFQPAALPAGSASPMIVGGTISIGGGGGSSVQFKLVVTDGKHARTALRPRAVTKPKHTSTRWLPLGTSASVPNDARKSRPLAVKFTGVATVICCVVVPSTATTIATVTAALETKLPVTPSMPCAASQTGVSTSALTEMTVVPSLQVRASLVTPTSAPSPWMAPEQPARPPDSPRLIDRSAIARPLRALRLLLRTRFTHTTAFDIF